MKKQRNSRWLMTRGSRMAVIACSAIWSCFAYAGSATGTVNVVNINATYSGVFLQLNISSSFNYDTSCPDPSWAFIPSSDPQYTSFLATMLAAKASGATITVTASTCITINGLIAQPRISSIDYGTRLSGT